MLTLIGLPVVHRTYSCVSEVPGLWAALLSHGSCWENLKPLKCHIRGRERCKHLMSLGKKCDEWRL